MSPFLSPFSVQKILTHNYLQYPRGSMVRYSLRDVFCLLTLAPFSAGVVYAADLLSVAVCDYIDPTLLRIDIIVGSPPRRNRTLFYLTLSAYESITYGGMFALVMLYLFVLRHRWATMLALSLPFGILFRQCLMPWLLERMVGQPVKVDTILLVAAIPPSLVAICLASLGWRVTNRMPTHELGTETAFFQRPPWQRYVVAASCLIYLSASAYGWYRMVSLRPGAW
jgi:hypothetical protein